MAKIDVVVDATKNLITKIMQQIIEYIYIELQYKYINIIIILHLIL